MKELKASLGIYNASINIDETVEGLEAKTQILLEKHVARMILDEELENYKRAIEALSSGINV